jgi:hypothetical protein
LAIVHKEVGDALLAERIAVQARTINMGSVTQGSSKHKILTAKLRGSAYCVIEKPLGRGPGQ